MAELFNITMPTDLSEWTSTSVGSGQSLARNATGGLNGDPSVRVTVVTTNNVHAEKTHTAIAPGTHQYYGLGFYVGGASAFTLANGGSVRMATVRTPSLEKAYIRLYNNSGTKQVQVLTNNDAGSGTSTTLHDLGSADWIYVLWTRSTNNATADGTAKLYLDGTLVQTSAGLILYDTFVFDRIRVGAIFISSSSSGTLDYGPVIARNDNTAITEPANDPPVNTIPSVPQFVAKETQVAIANPPSVAEGSASVTSVRVYCTSGDLNVTLSGSVTITAGANNSSDLTLGNGASITEYNTVLGTLKYTGDTDFRGEDAINIISSDGTLSDTDSWQIFVALTNMVLTGSHADIVATFATLTFTLDADQTTDTINIVATDSGARTDSQAVTVMLAPTSGDGDLPLLSSTRVLTDVIM